MKTKRITFLLLLSIPALLLAFGCGGKEMTPPHGDFRPGKDAAEPIVYTVRLPVDAALVNLKDLPMGIHARLRFGEKGTASVAVELEEGPVKVEKSGDTWTCFLAAVAPEEEIREIGPGGAPKDPPDEEEEAKAFRREETGLGAEGLEMARKIVAGETADRGVESMVTLDPCPRTPIGLVLEAFRRMEKVPGVVGVTFQGGLEPIGEEEDILPSGKTTSLDVDEKRAADPVDGNPTLRIVFRKDSVAVAVPEKMGANADGKPAREGIPLVMKAFAARFRDEENPRLCRASMTVVAGAEEPFALLQWILQEAVKPGIGIWKIHFLLPDDHPHAR